MYVFLNVVFALFLREVQRRFGTQKLGYFWAIFEPFAFVSIFVFVKINLFNFHQVGIDVPVFIAIGFLEFFLFRNIVKRSIGAFEANKALFFYAVVKPIHTIFARVCVECFISIFLFCLFLFIGWYFNFKFLPDDLFLLFISTVWFVLFSFNFGLLFAVIGSFYESFKKVVDIAFTPLIFISAVFYSIDGINEPLRTILLLNPLVHFMEMFHASYFKVLGLDYVNCIYLLFWTLVPCYTGLFIYFKVKDKIRAI